MEDQIKLAMLASPAEKLAKLQAKLMTIACIAEGYASQLSPSLLSEALMEIKAISVDGANYA